MLTGAKVLVIRDAGLGDVLMTTPLIRRLVLEHGAVVDVLTKEQYRCLFDHNPFVRQTFALETDRGDWSAWDITLDLRLIVENAEAAGAYRHRADAFAEFGDVHLTPEERQLDFYLTDEERETGRRIVRLGEGHLPQKGTIGYVWRSSTRNRNWSMPMHRHVLGALLSAGYGVVLLDHERMELTFWDVEGYTTPENFAPSLCNTTGFHSLREVAAMMSACDVVVTPDTGLFHLAGALNLPTVAYFGAMPVAERAAHKTLRVLNNAGACSLLPCRSYSCLNFDKQFQSACLGVSTGEVVAAVEAAIQPLRSEVADQEGKERDATGNRMAGPTTQRDAQAGDTGRDPAGELGPELGYDSGADDPVRDSAPDGKAGLRTRRRVSGGKLRSVLQPNGD
jgi:ADP-heptose:LPS heptosyltransferase